LNNPWGRCNEINDTHGLGALLMADAETIKAKDKLVDLVKKDVQTLLSARSY
jgi:hypothetical protein